jgi:hypothetical protein
MRANRLALVLASVVLVVQLGIADSRAWTVRSPGALPPPSACGAVSQPFGMGRGTIPAPDVWSESGRVDSGSDALAPGDTITARTRAEL